MNRKVPGLAIWIICAALATMLSSSWLAIGSSDSMLSLSLPRVGLSADQWVGEYHCTLEGFRVVAIRDVPYIWFTDVANQKAGKASLDAGHWLGTGPMGKDPIEDLQQILVLQRSTGGKKHNCPSVNCRLYVQNFH